jgi:hypothetical protein
MRGISLGLWACGEEVNNLRGQLMQELLRTNDIVYISFAQAMLRTAGIESYLLDEAQSSMDGSIGAIPRRVLVAQAQFEEAKEILRVLAQEIEEARD